MLVAGGYYMGMACEKIVAEPLTITGSIGVVAGGSAVCTLSLAQEGRGDEFRDARSFQRLFRAWSGSPCSVFSCCS